MKNFKVNYCCWLFFR